MFYLTSDIWLRTILIVRKETCCRHIGYSYWLTARVLLYAPSHKQDNTYHSLCYNRRGALAGMKNSSMGPPHEGSTRRPIAPWANTLPLSYVPLLVWQSTENSVFSLTEYREFCVWFDRVQILLCLVWQSTENSVFSLTEYREFCV